MRRLNTLPDACVMPETVSPVYKYRFILADKKNEIDICLSTFSFFLKRVVLAVVVDNDDLLNIFLGSQQSIS